MIYFAKIHVGKFTTSRCHEHKPERDIFFIKIGCSNNPLVRMKTLEWEYEKRLELLAVMPGDQAKEAEMHRRFAHLRVGRTWVRGRHCGDIEWFYPVRELMDFIADVARNQGLATIPEKTG